MIYAANIKEPVDDGQIAKFVKLVSLEKRKRIEKYHFRNDFLRSLYGDIMVRIAIEKITGIKSQDLKFEKNEYGKPHVCKIPDIHFNISHSGDWVVCVISKYNCGIDIEKTAAIDLKIAERFFSKTEFETLACKDEEEQKDYFYDLWTLKESYVKWKGEGLYIPFNSFSLEKKDGYFCINQQKKDNIMFRQYEIAEGYKMSVCSQEIIKKIIYMNMMQL